MKKKTLALVMTAAMAFSALTGCGSTGSAPDYGCGEKGDRGCDGGGFRE